MAEQPQENTDSSIAALKRASETLLCNNRIQLAAIFLLGLFAYANTFFSPFLTDDDLFAIVNNKAIRDFGSIDWWHNRAVGFFSFAVNYSLHGLKVPGYHAVNLLIHVLNACLVLAVVKMTFQTPFFALSNEGPNQSYERNFIALFSALFFVVHPVQTQAVTNIWQRLASLATFFYLASLCAYIQYRLATAGGKDAARETAGTASSGDHGMPPLLWYIISLFCGILAMKTKEISFTLPLLIVLYEFSFFNSRFSSAARVVNARRLLLLLPVILLLLIIPLSVFRSLSEQAHLDSSVVQDRISREQINDLTNLSKSSYLLTQFRVIMTYLRLLVFPVGQEVYYDYPLYSSFLDPPVLLSFFFLTALGVAALFLFWHSRSRLPGASFLNMSYSLPRLLSFGIFWFFITLSVESSFLPIRDVIFEHRVYLPSVGFFIAVCTAAAMSARLIRIRVHYQGPDVFHVFSGAALVFVLIFSIAAHQRNETWRDAISFWGDAARKAPASARVHFNLGMAYYGKKMFGDAIEELSAAVRLASRTQYFGTMNPQAVYNALGLACYQERRLDEAVHYFNTALQLGPGSSSVYYNLGLAYVLQKRTGEATEQFLSSARLNPANISAYFQAGKAFLSMGRADSAIECYEKALKLNTNNADVHHGLAQAFAQKGERHKAVLHFQRALDLRPNDISARRDFDELLKGISQ